MTSEPRHPKSPPPPRARVPMGLMAAGLALSMALLIAGLMTATLARRAAEESDWQARCNEVARMLSQRLDEVEKMLLAVQTAAARDMDRVGGGEFATRARDPIAWQGQSWILPGPPEKTGAGRLYVLAGRAASPQAVTGVVSEARMIDLVSGVARPLLQLHRELAVWRYVSAQNFVAQIPGDPSPQFAASVYQTPGFLRALPEFNRSLGIQWTGPEVQSGRMQLVCSAPVIAGGKLRGVWQVCVDARRLEMQLLAAEPARYVLCDRQGQYWLAAGTEPGENAGSWLAAQSPPDSRGWTLRARMARARFWQDARAVAGAPELLVVYAMNALFLSALFVTGRYYRAASDAVQNYLLDLRAGRPPPAAPSMPNGLLAIVRREKEADLEQIRALKEAVRLTEQKAVRLAVEGQQQQRLTQEQLAAERRKAGELAGTHDELERQLTEARRRIVELRNLSAISMERELRMMDLKKEVDALLIELKRPPEYFKPVEGMRKWMPAMTHLSAENRHEN